jgi:colicin import membrane protein
MVIVSLCLHLALFALLLFAPEVNPSRKRFGSAVYTVDLVDLPQGGGQKAVPQGQKTLKPSQKPKPKAKRIDPSPKKTKPVTIAKRTAPKKTKKPVVKKKSSSQLIDQAISKIERKVEADRPSHLDQALADLQKKTPQVGKGGGSSERGGGGGGGPVTGIAMRLYELEINNWIKENWAYPVALGQNMDLEATVLLTVRRNGSISRTQFLKRSGNAIFDQSVTKAVEKSDPLPPFPEGYNRNQEDIEVSFNLKEFEEG